MRYTGKIEKIDNIVVSDPSYKKDVWCRYERENIKGKNWVVSLDIEEQKEKIGGKKYKFIDVNVLLSKDSSFCILDRVSNICYASDIETKKTKIGIDTACVALGINEKANVINNTQDEWQPNYALKIGNDGICGEVIEGCKDDEVKFIYISTSFDGEILKSKKIFDYIIKQLEIVNLKKMDYDLIDEDRIYKNGSKVEVRECSINNNNMGTIMIRNSNYKSEVEGTKLTVVNPDGSKETTTLKSFDTIVNSPIIVEIKSNFYDYETGYHYKGEIVNDDLIKELKKLKIINSEKPLISFSEFEVENIIDNNVEKSNVEL